MQISKILETKNKLIRENTADVVKAMTPMMILYQRSCERTPSVEHGWR